MFFFDVPLSEVRLVTAAPGAVYQAARWMKQFHAERFLHIGWKDHPEGSAAAEVLSRYGFIAVPRFELNWIRQILETYGPVLLQGAFRHQAHHEVTLPIPGMDLARVARYEEGEHAIVLNGYWDGRSPSLLYRDPEHPRRQFVLGLEVLLDRLDPDAGVHYLNCALFPKPCAHMRKPAPQRQPAEP